MLAGVAVGLSLLVPALLAAQEFDDNDAPLGDVARSLRKKNLPSQQEIIDNDNLSKVMDDVESRRVSRLSLMHSIDDPGKAFQASSPDVTCSLSFSANAKSLLSGAYVQMELPADQLLKLSGPAAIHGDSFEVSVFNGTDWHVSEVAVALTVVKHTDFPEASLHDRPGSPRSGNDGMAKLVPAAAIEPLQESEQRSENRSGKRPDVAVLYRMRAAAAPFGVTVFATPLNIDIGPDQEWHWAIVQAKGYPPRQLSEPTTRDEAATTRITKQPEIVQPNLSVPEGAPVPSAPVQLNPPYGGAAPLGQDPSR